MKKILIILALTAPVFGFSQTFYIDAKDKYSYNQIEEKVKELGYKSTDSATADYKLRLIVWVTSKLNSMYKGHLILEDKLGKEVARSKDSRRGAVAVNGYNASYNIAKVIADKELPTLLHKIKSQHQ